MSTEYTIIEKDKGLLSILEHSCKADLLFTKNESIVNILRDLTPEELATMCQELLLVTYYVGGDDRYWDLSDKVKELINDPTN